MPRYFLQISYLGTAYHGWQRQSNAPSVQEQIEGSLSRLFNQETAIVGCGRTDTGVHASDYYAHFDIEKSLDLDKTLYQLNAILPKDIAVHRVIPVSSDAHARFDAQMRTYTYFLHFNKSPFKEGRSLLVYRPLDFDAMTRASQHLIGRHEFTSFARLHGNQKTDYCSLSEAKWILGENEARFQISADRFLRNMVRAIVGTLLEVGEGKRAEGSIPELLALRDRNRAGSSAGAQGLFLSKISYPYIEHYGE